MHSVPDANPKTACWHGLQGDQGADSDDLAPVSQRESPHFLPCRQRRDQGVLSLHAAFKPLVLPLGQGKPQILRQRQVNAVSLSFPHLAGRDGRARGVELPGLKKTVAVVQQGAGRVSPGLRAVCSHDHGDQAHALAFGRRHQAIPGAVGAARLDAIHAVIPPQQGVAIELLDVVIDELLDGVQRIDFRIVPDQASGQERQVLRGGVVIFIRPSGAVHKVGVIHAQGPGLLVHQCGKLVFGARHILRQGHAGVVAGLDDHPFQQRVNADFFANLDEHAGPLHAPRLLTDDNLVLQGELVPGQLAGDHIGGHHLGQAGGFHPVFRVLLRQVSAGGGVHQQIRHGVDLRRVWRLRAGGGCRAQGGAKQCREDQSWPPKAARMAAGKRARLFKAHGSLQGDAVIADAKPAQAAGDVIRLLDAPQRADLNAIHGVAVHFGPLYADPLF